jgi:2,4-dienoyl-CoA reductase-like NADH-dependent reductase (Old Yellow Enzyme family)
VTVLGNDETSVAAGKGSPPVASELSAIWEPLQIGPMKVKHRIMMTPHSQTYGIGNVPSDRHVAYYRERAKGGLSLIGLEQTAGHRWGKAAYTTALTAWERGSVEPFSRIAEALHEYGCCANVELAGVGVTDPGRMFIDEWHPPYGPSAVPSVLWNIVPAEMDSGFISELISDFGTSAVNMRDAGMDSIELHSGHGYLLSQMLSPMYNRRSDRYGGSARKRCQLALDIANEIRDRIGDELALGIRLSYDEFIGEPGITPDLADEYVAVMNDAKVFDFFDITGGSYHTLHLAVAPMGGPEEGFMVEYARRAKAIVGDTAKVFTVGRIKRLETAEEIVRSGAADMVAMLRSHIADPFLIEKARSGRSDEIVRCVGGNDCIIAAFNSQMLTCAVNPTTGREASWGNGTLTPVTTPRRVVVIGAGPAGLKAAQVAATRGHEVTLLESAPEVGGHLRLLSQLPGQGDWTHAIEDLWNGTERHGVEAALGTQGTVDNLRELDPDVVICATGASWERTGYTVMRPDREAIPGVEQANVVDVATAITRALEDPTSLGRRVMILDESKGYFPIGLADLLSREGVEVEIVSRHLTVGEEVIASLQAPHVFPRLTQAGVRLSPQRFVEAIDGDKVTTYSIWGGQEVGQEVDTVVLSMLRKSNDDLFRAAKEKLASVHRIGDALSPRKAGDAIYEGEKIGREI